MKKKGWLFLMYIAIAISYYGNYVFAEQSDNPFRDWGNGILVYVTQQGTDDIGIIDPVKMKKIGSIKGVGGDNHNCFTSYDGMYLYVTAGAEIVKASLQGKKGGKVVARKELMANNNYSHANISPNHYEIHTEAHLAHAALTLDCKYLYISDAKDNVMVVNADTLDLEKTINMSAGLDDVIKIVKSELEESWDDADSNPHGLAIHPGGKYIYVPLVWSGAVAVIDTSKNEVVTTLNLNASESDQQGHGTTPVALGFSTDGRWCFVSCAAPGYICILDTSDPANPKIETTVPVGLSPIQVPANPTNRYFIAPCQTSSLLNNEPSSVPDPVINNSEWIDWINNNKDTAIDLVEALLSALHTGTPVYPNDNEPDACFIVEIEDNYDHDGTSWEVIDTIETGVGPHGVSYTPGGQLAFVTLSQEKPGKVAAIAETKPGEFKIIHSIKVGTFPNGIATRFGRNQNM